MTDQNQARALPKGSENQRPGRAANAGSPGLSKSAPSRQGGPAGRSAPRSARDGEAASVLIELSQTQVDHVIRAAGQGGTMSVLLSALKDPEWMLSGNDDKWAYPSQMEDRRLSRSLLSGLLVLACFSCDGAYLGIAELARMLDMNTSTTHRYVTTLLAVGLLERDPSTRRYRIAPE